MITGKTIALTRRTFVDKVISLLLNMLSRLVITFLPRSKHLLISWLLQSRIKDILNERVLSKLKIIQRSFAMHSFRSYVLRVGSGLALRNVCPRKHTY